MRPTATSRPASAPLASEPLDLVSRATNAMVRAGGDVQQQWARSTGALQQQAMRQLRQATNPAEILAVQAAFMLAGCSSPWSARRCSPMPGAARSKARAAAVPRCTDHPPPLAHPCHGGIAAVRLIPSQR